MNIDSRLRRIAAAQPYPVLFATICCAHLYPDGSGSPDSAFDLRAPHGLPLEKVVRPCGGRGTLWASPKPHES